MARPAVRALAGDAGALRPLIPASLEIDVFDGQAWLGIVPFRVTNVAPYRPLGPAHAPVAGTLEHFLTERYCLFSVDGSFHARTLDIHHPPWPLQPAEAEIQVNTMADAAGIRLPSMAPLLHFARRQDMVAWTLRRLGE